MLYRRHKYYEQYTNMYIFLFAYIFSDSLYTLFLNHFCILNLVYAVLIYNVTFYHGRSFLAGRIEIFIFSLYVYKL